MELKVLGIDLSKTVFQLHGVDHAGRARWVNDLVARRGTNRAIVAVANKNARVIWSLLAKGGDYRPQVAA